LWRAPPVGSTGFILLSITLHGLSIFSAT
jgi:hypothetical protein